MAAIGDTVYPTLAQLRQVVYCQSAGLVTCDGIAPTYDDPDRGVTFLTSAAIALAITLPSAKEQNLHPADLDIAQRVPPINQTSCDLLASRDFSGLTIVRRNNVPIFGPNDALTLVDWIGSGGVPTANGAGQFTVTGAGTLGLTIPSSYEQRLTEIPLETAPEGCPGGYWYRRADHYWPAWGNKEGIYCWLGWERLDIPITAPSACTLTLTVTYRKYTLSDNHKTDSTRATEFEWAYTDHTATYTLAVAAGAQTLHVTLVAPNGGDYPLFERVGSMVLSGFANGAWVIGEPTLVQSSPSQAILKTFEGVDPAAGGWKSGGASIHADAAFEWYGSAEDNAGHAPNAEKVVLFADYVVGAVSGLDLTTAYTLTGWAGVVSAVSEVFDASEDTAVTDAATVDNETPPNTLSVLWGFDVCYADAEGDVANPNPLEQSVVGGAANVSLRCETWSIVAGIKCAVVTDKIVDGRIHGRALTGTALLRSTSNVGNLYRRYPGDTAWSWVQLLDADAYGHFMTASLDEACDYLGADGAMRRWLYAVGNHAEDLDEVGAVYAREYVHATMEAVGKRWPDLWHGPWDTTYLVYKDTADKVRVQKSFNAGAGWLPAVAVTPPGWTYPAVCKTIKGDLLVTATDTAETKTKVWKSRSDGSSFVSLAFSLAGTRMDMMTGMGPRKYGVLLDGGQQELRETVQDFSTTLSRPSALAGGGSSLKTSTVITTDAGNARAAILRDPKCNLFAALVNDASHVKVWRSRENGFGWASTARSFVGVEADATLGAGPKAYLAARSGGTLRWYRGLRQLSTVLDSATIATDVDAERPAVWKLNSRGREALAAVTVGGTVRIYGSRDDGKTWSQKA